MVPFERDQWHNLSQYEVYLFLFYCFNQGTAILPILHSVLFDENEWETPYKFNPGHFLDKQGKFVRQDAFMPFSAGKVNKEVQKETLLWIIYHSKVWFRKVFCLKKMYTFI